MAKGFSGTFLKRYPETIVIPIMQTGAEGRITFRACIFLPHFSQNGAFLSFTKWCTYSFFRRLVFSDIFSA